MINALIEGEYRGTYPGSKKALPVVGETKPEPKQEKQEWDARPLKKWINGKEVELFAIGALCKALGRPPVTLRLWIRQGHLPREPFRLPTRNGIKGRRLYARQHIEAIIRVATEHGIIDSPRVDWSKHPTFADDIRTAWATITL